VVGWGAEVLGTSTPEGRNGMVEIIILIGVVLIDLKLWAIVLERRRHNNVMESQVAAKK
jgi:hypothetical protein